MDLLKLIDNYGRACRRDGSPAWESDEGQALKVALESRASNAGGAVHQVLDVDTCSWHDVTPDYYAERLPSNRRVLYTHPAPASKEPVADERAALYQAIHDALMEHDLSYTEDTGSGEKFPLVDKLCAPGDKTIQTGKDEIAILTETILDAIPPARAALATAQTWQPIETAPKDGKILLLMGDTIHIGYWSDEKYAARPKPYWATVASWFGVTWMRNNQPTHWMPLPNPPKEIA